MEPEGSLPRLQEPAICPCSEPVKFCSITPPPPIQLTDDQYQYYSSIYAWVIKVYSECYR
jgi:hypothetical protein